jgi:alkanesulfonate monooxygenase SsuD/methylene tetrahydromethanopterin reductase-like flavin-dependent oxidoreductase (luciferase family)
MDAIEAYRRSFRPSDRLAQPHLMLGVTGCAADGGEEARLLLTSLQQAFIHLRSGRPAALPPPVENFSAQLAPDPLTERRKAETPSGPPRSRFLAQRMLESA